MNPTVKDHNLKYFGSINLMNTNKYDLLILDYGGTYSFEYDINAHPGIMTKAFGRAPSESEQALISPLSHKLAEVITATEEWIM